MMAKMFSSSVISFSGTFARSIEFCQAYSQWELDSQFSFDCPRGSAMKNWKRNLFIVGLVAGVATSGLTVVLASIPDSNSGEISGCYSTKSGALRVVDAQAGRTCSSGERLLKWPSLSNLPTTPELVSVVVGTRLDIGTNGQWLRLPNMSISIPASAKAKRAHVHFYGSAYCYGIQDSRKYIRIRTDTDSSLPQDAFSAPVAPITSSVDPANSETSVSIVRPIEVQSNSTITISTEIYTEPNSSCVFNPGTAVLTALLVAS